MLSELPEGDSLPTGTDELLAIREGVIGWLVINRPERRNALCGTIWAPFQGRWRHWRRIRR